ncbi:MAG: tryptophan-rich sensory protein [Clostridia bacterium]|nr:tryptophan-rich sensory protein [Clostridia bacterium]
MTKSSTNKTETTNQNKNVKHKWWIDALLFIGGTIALGGLATLLGGKMFSFEGYQMPPGTVPKIVFPFAWAIIYIAIGVSTFLMWRDKEINSKNRRINLILYFVHMAFNISWPLFFFRLNLPIVSCIILVALLSIALVCLYRYFITNLPSGIIFSIYSLWLIYALYLNLGIVLINF